MAEDTHYRRYLSYVTGGGERDDVNYIDPKVYKKGSYHDINKNHCCLCKVCKDEDRRSRRSYKDIDNFRENHHYKMLCKLHRLIDAYDKSRVGICG